MPVPHFCGAGADISAGCRDCGSKVSVKSMKLNKSDLVPSLL